MGVWGRSVGTAPIQNNGLLEEYQLILWAWQGRCNHLTQQVANVKHRIEYQMRLMLLVSVVHGIVWALRMSDLTLSPRQRHPSNWLPHPSQGSLTTIHGARANQLILTFIQSVVEDYAEATMASATNDTNCSFVIGPSFHYES